MKLFWHEIVSLGCFSGLIRVNTHTPERFLYRIQKNDPA